MLCGDSSAEKLSIWSMQYEYNVNEHQAAALAGMRRINGVLIVKIGMSIPSTIDGVDIDTLKRWMQVIDEGPYSRLSTGERIASPFLDLQIVLAAAAALTKRVPIQSLISLVPLHEEVLIAKQAASIDVLSNGRYTLGVGVGVREYDYQLMNKQDYFKGRLARLDRQVETLREIWRGEYALPKDAPPIGPSPIQPGGPKIFSSSLGPKSMARSAHWADGLAGFNLTADLAELKQVHDGFAQAWQQAGRSGKPWMQVALWFSLGPGAEEKLRTFAKDYMMIFGPEFAEQQSQRCWLNSEDNIRKAVAQLAEIGYDEVILTPTSGDLAELELANELVTAL